MKGSIAVLLGICMGVVPAQAQPLSGTYTIGGVGPDFATCADAVSALATNGVSGEVRMRIRPGVYEPAAAGSPVFDIPDPIAGVTASDRVLFEADPATGGSANNVIVRVASGASLATTALLAYVRSDFVGFSDLTFEFADTSVIGRLGQNMVHFSTGPGNSEMNGAQVLDCKFLGRTSNGRAHAAIQMQGHNRDTRFERNDIQGATEGISFSGHWSYSPVVSGNAIAGTTAWITGGSAEVGSAIKLATTVDGVIADNDLDYGNGASGQNAISLGNSRRLLLDGNVIRGPSQGNGVGPNDTFFAIHIQTDGNFADQGGTVANNSIANVRPRTSRGFHFVCDNLLIAHNSVVSPPRSVTIWSRTGPLYLDGTGCRVMDNIFIELDNNTDFVYAMVLADTTGNEFDHNDLHNSGGGNLVRVDATDFPNLFAWQATGYDLSSVSILPNFVDSRSDLHLAGCSISDPQLRGVGLAEVTSDFDGETRDASSPFLGADETSGVLPAYFDPPLDYHSGFSSWQMTSGDFDGDGAVDLAVTNSPFNNGSNDVAILYNHGAGNFLSRVHWAFANQPNLVRAGHMNGDDNLDLLVSSETADSLLLRLGFGGGNFSAPMLVDQSLAITDFEIADYDADGDQDVIMLISPSADSGYVNIRINDGSGFFTWNNVAAAGWHLDDLAIADFDDDGFVDLAIVDNTTTNSVSILRNLGVHEPGLSKGFAAPVTYYENVRSTATQSNFMVGDFDGDQDLDLILGDALGLENLVFLRNQGDGTLAPRENVPVDPDRTYRLSTAFDYEGDGDLDIVTANHTLDLHLLRNDGSAQFELLYVCDEGPIQLATAPQVMIAAPLDADERPDLAVLHLADTVQVLRNLDFVPVAVGDGPRESSGLVLHQNAPNPVRDGTTISFQLPRAQHVRLDVYNVAGRRVANLVNGPLGPGVHVVKWSGEGASSGVYFYQLQGEGFRESRKMILVR